MGWWRGAAWTGWGGLWGGVLVVSCAIFKCVFVAVVGVVVGLLVSSSSASCLPRWEGAPVIRAIWQWCGGVKEALDQLAPVFLVRSFVNPISQGAISVDLDCGYFPEKEAEVLNHEVFSRCLWASHASFVVAACGDHVARGAVRWSAYHFSDKVHLSRGDHVANARDGVEHLSHFVVVEPLFTDCGH
jgi:hypothetical protein